MKLFKIISFIILFFFTGNIFSQQFSNYFPTNSYTSGMDYDFDFYFWDGYFRPTIEVNYGFGYPKIKSFDDSFERVGQFQIKLGYSSVDSYDRSILEYQFDYLFFSGLSDRYKTGDNKNKVRTDTWQFGWGHRFGFGYGIGNSVAILPYNERGMVWSSISVTDNFYRDAIDNPGDILNPDKPEYDPLANTLAKFDGTFRFGYNQEAGLNFEVVKFLNLGASYEFNTIYPRTLFWKAAGSLIISEVAQGALTYFIQEIMDSTPSAGPIVAFILKNGLSYGYYLLSREKMNWPFSTEKPLTYETFKINIGFAF
jgi:hypothetical protein